MWAAGTAADATVAFLLSKGASPDLMDNNDNTALDFAIQSGCSSTIDLLAPVTTQGFHEALKILAAFNTELTPALEDLLRRAASDKDAAMKGVVNAAHFGAAKMLTILTRGWDNNTLDPTKANQLLELSLMSDNAETVDIVKAFVPSVSSGNIVLALTRGRADVVKLLGLGEDESSAEAAKQRLGRISFDFWHQIIVTLLFAL